MNKIVTFAENKSLKIKGFYKFTGTITKYRHVDKTSDYQINEVDIVIVGLLCRSNVRFK